jgi:hypothetical protein
MTVRKLCDLNLGFRRGRRLHGRRPLGLDQVWHHRSGVEVEHLENLMAWKARLDARSSVVKALKDEA